GRADAGPPPGRIERRVLRQRCGRDTVVMAWLDAWPGRLVPADTAVLRLEWRDPDGERRVTWDDDPGVEVRALRRHGRSGYEWEVRWSGHARSGAARITVLPRAGFPDSLVMECGRGG
ncbi:MAG: hypothetical protein AB7I33_14410, partial [Gemmatimonadales bacterium]